TGSWNARARRKRRPAVAASPDQPLRPGCAIVRSGLTDGGALPSPSRPRFPSRSTPRPCAVRAAEALAALVELVVRVERPHPAEQLAHDAIPLVRSELPGAVRLVPGVPCRRQDHEVRRPEVL